MPATLKIDRHRARRKGSVTVLALMVSLLIMILITATMTMTIINNDVMGDYARNKKTLQAADSGIQHGRLTLARALTGWELPAGAQKDQIDQYASDATSGSQLNDRDISLLMDAGLNFSDIVPRNTTVATADTENAGDLTVKYETSMNVIPTSVDLPGANDITYQHTFHYDYFITSQGDATLGGQYNQATRVQRGSFSLEVKRPSFSTYGYFTESMRNNLGAQLWFYNGEVYDGPTHVNSTADTSAFYGRPIFKGAFTSVQGSAGDTYQTSGALLAGAANPDFQAGQSWGVSQIPTPTNGWSQLRASVGDYNGAADAVAPTNTELRNLLGLTPGASPVSKGVFYAPSNNSASAPDPLGGIFINGDVEQITFSASGTSQTIVVRQNNPDGDYSGQQDWVFVDDKSTGTLTVTRNGLPAGVWNSNLNGVIHVAGTVKSVTGDGTLGGADIQTNQQITLSVDGDIVVNDHLTYQSNPATNPNAENVLGLFSSGGNIMLGQAAPSNLTVNATVMAVAPGKGVGAEGLVTGSSYNKNYGNKGNWNLLGGLIENTNQTTGVVYADGTQAGYTWNFSYDQRFQSGTAPPYFPYVTKFTATIGQIQDEALGRKYY